MDPWSQRRKAPWTSHQRAFVKHGPTQTKPNQAKPTQTKPNRPKPSQTDQNQAKPIQFFIDLVKIGGRVERGIPPTYFIYPSRYSTNCNIQAVKFIVEVLSNRAIQVILSSGEPSAGMFWIRG